MQKTVDVAVYGGHEEHPVKLAILCDELPFNMRDRVLDLRRRDFNLQAAGWLTVRFQTFEIIEELENVASGKHGKLDVNQTVDWIMKRQMRFIDDSISVKPDLYKRLTGWDLKSNSQ